MRPIGSPSPTIGSACERNSCRLWWRASQSLEHFDTSSRAGFTQASHDLRGASETLDGRVGVFVKDFARDFQAIPLKDPQLVEFRGRYIAQVEQMGQDVHELSTTVRDLGDLFARIDPAAITSEYQARRIKKAKPIPSAQRKARMAPTRVSIIFAC